MMTNFIISTTTTALITVLSATSVSSAPKIICTKKLTGKDHIITLTFENNLLQIQESSSTARYAPVTHKLKPISFVRAPSEKPQIKCSEKTTELYVWKQWVRVNAQYFEIAQKKNK